MSVWPTYHFWTCQLVYISSSYMQDSLYVYPTVSCNRCYVSTCMLDTGMLHGDKNPGTNGKTSRESAMTMIESNLEYQR